MTIDEAIKYSTGVIEDFPITIGNQGVEAIKLGLEALKQLKAIRHAHPAFWTFLMQGETTEESTTGHET